MQLKIGFSYAPQHNPKYRNYTNAFIHAGQTLGHDVDCILLMDDPSRISEVDAVVFTGGADVAPERYGKAEEVSLCNEIDEERDQIEFDIAKQANEAKLPIFGICRGLQLINVVHGGTLITDVEHFGGHDHKKLNETTDNRHNIKLTSGSHLYKIMRQLDGEVNSAHHQAIDRLGEGLTVSARDDKDGTIEAIEWEDPSGKPYLLAVQWHPERMGYDERFSGPLLESFLWEVAAHKLLRERMKPVAKRAASEG